MTPIGLPEIVFVDDATLGYCNYALGTVLDSTQSQFPPADASEGDPTIFPAPEPNLSNAVSVLGIWYLQILCH